MFWCFCNNFVYVCMTYAHAMKMSDCIVSWLCVGGKTATQSCVCVCGFVIASNWGRKCDTLLSDRGRFENGDGPHPEN